MRLRIVDLPRPNSDVEVPFFILLDQVSDVQAVAQDRGGIAREVGARGVLCFEGTVELAED